VSQPEDYDRHLSGVTIQKLAIAIWRYNPEDHGRYPVSQPRKSRSTSDVTTQKITIENWCQTQKIEIDIWRNNPEDHDRYLVLQHRRSRSTSNVTTQKIKTDIWCHYPEDRDRHLTSQPRRSRPISRVTTQKIEIDIWRNNPEDHYRHLASQSTSNRLSLLLVPRVLSNKIIRSQKLNLTPFVTWTALGNKPGYLDTL
jgi:hypothetical protein